MATPRVVVDVEILHPRDVSDELRAMWDHALKRLNGHRGGPELYRTILRDVE